MSGILTVPTAECKIGGTTIAAENILEINLHLGCTREVSTFSIVIDNSNPDYNSGDYSPGGAKEPIKGSSITIKIKRGTITSDTNYLLSGTLEIREYLDEVEDYQYRNIVILSGRCVGLQMFNQKYDGDLIADVGTSYKAYKRTSGEAESLVAYLIDNYTLDKNDNPLSHIRETSVATANAAAAQKVVNVTDGTKFAVDDLVKIYDDNGWEYNKIDSIATNALTMVSDLVNSYTTAANLTVGVDLIRDSDTTYTKMEYVYESIFDIIKWIADTTDTGGTIGYDSRIEYDGKYAFLPRGAVTESYSLATQVQIERYIDDSTRIKNRIKVFGKADKPFPFTQSVDDGNDYSDHWTETYSCLVAQLVLDADSGQKKIAIPYDRLSDFSVADYCWLIQYDHSKEQGQIASISTDSELGTGDAASGQKIVDVADGSTFTAGDLVRIYDDLTSEYNVIDSISTNQLTMVNNLANSYTVANNLAVVQNFISMEDNLTTSYTTAKKAIMFLSSNSEVKLWGYIPFTSGDWDNVTVNLSATQATEGSWSISAESTSTNLINLLFSIEEGSEINFNDYDSIRGLFYFDTTAPATIYVSLYSGDIHPDTTPYGDNSATHILNISPTADVWKEFSIGVGAEHENIWIVRSGFDWTDIKLMLIFVGYTGASAAHKFYLDKFHIYGGRWGGGTNHAAIDGFAEDTTSQTTYGIREHVVINDLILSDAECEAKALSLLAFYKSPRVTIVPDSRSLDWGDYPVIPGNKVTVNLTPLGISGDYRIDSVDITLNAIDHELDVVFAIDNTPPRRADYLQGIVDRIKILERSSK